MTTDREGRWFRRVGVILIVLVGGIPTLGCGGAEPKAEYARRVIEVKDLPATVIDAARKQLPGIGFDESWGNVDAKGVTVSYEVRGRDSNGKIREVRVSLDGQILEVE